MEPRLVQASLGGLSYGRAIAVAASLAILTVGIFAALNQLMIAPAIVNGLFYAILAVVAGSAIVAIGGGGIVPMRGMWDRAFEHIESQSPKIATELHGAPERVQHRAQEIAVDAQHLPRDEAEAILGAHMRDESVGPPR